MYLDVAVQMDPIDRIDRSVDTTFFLMLEAQRREHELFYYRPENLSYENGKVVARGFNVTVADIEGEHVKFGAMRKRNLDSCDVILIRQDPPVNMAYLTASFLLDRLTRGTLVVNDPRGLRDAPEKLSVLDFPDLIPPTLISRDLATIADFREMHGSVVIKPLYGNGGVDIFRLEPNDANVSVILESFQRHYAEPFVIQKYVPEVVDGDKRIILIDGKPAGAINRVPLAGELRANMHVGGRAEGTGLTERDLQICSQIGPFLSKNGLLLAGIDVIGSYLTEINVTSPTGMREIADITGSNPAKTFWDSVEKIVQ